MEDPDWAPLVQLEQVFIENVPVDHFTFTQPVATFSLRYLAHDALARGAAALSGTAGLWRGHLGLGPWVAHEVRDLGSGTRCVIRDHGAPGLCNLGLPRRGVGALVWDQGLAS